MNQKMSQNTNLPRAIIFLFAIGVACISSSVLYAQAADEKPVRIAILYHTPSENDIWWGMVTGFAAEVAEDLNIELELVESDLSPISFINHTKLLLATERPPDYILTPNYVGTIKHIMPLVNKSSTRLFLFNAGLNEEQRALFGSPREKYVQWIGEMLPDDETAGYELARQLIASTRQSGVEQVNMLAISGNKYNQAAYLRSRGLRRAIEEDPNAHLLQEVSGRWFRDTAAMKIPVLMKRHPTTNVIWAANDSMALGVLDVIDSTWHGPVGGFDWTAPALTAIWEGDMFASMGGHFMEAGWALVLLFDFHQGRDFVGEGVSRKTPLFFISKKTVPQSRQIVDRDFWRKIKFANFSKTRTPELHTYDFSIEKIMDSIEQQ